MKKTLYGKEGLLYDTELSFQKNLAALNAGRLQGVSAADFVGTEVPEKRHPTTPFPHRCMPNNQLVGMTSLLEVAFQSMKFVIDLLARQGGGIACTKSLRSREFTGNNTPNLAGVVTADMNADRTEESLKKKKMCVEALGEFASHSSWTNNFAIPSPSPEIWISEVASAVDYGAAKGVQVVPSVIPTTWETPHTDEGYLEDVRLVTDFGISTGAKKLCINLSNPHKPVDLPKNPCEGEQFHFPEAARRVMQAASEVATPAGVGLVAKLGFIYKGDMNVDRQILQTVIRAIAPYVDAVIITNTLPRTAVNETGDFFFGEKRQFAGVSGALIFEYALEMVMIAAEITHGPGMQHVVDVWATGGATNPMRIWHFFNAGAKVVLSGTGLMNNPALFADYYRFLGC